MPVLSKHAPSVTVPKSRAPAPPLFSAMLEAYARDPLGLYGPIRRTCDSSGYHLANGTFNSVLPGLSLTSKRAMRELRDDIMESDDPYLRRVLGQNANGEDLMVNWPD